MKKIFISLSSRVTESIWRRMSIYQRRDYVRRHPGSRFVEKDRRTRLSLEEKGQLLADAEREKSVLDAEIAICEDKLKCLRDDVDILRSDKNLLRSERLGLKSDIQHYKDRLDVASTALVDVEAVIKTYG